MSNHLRKYQGISKDAWVSEMHITSTSQGKFGIGVQFTIGNWKNREYVILAENQVKDLIDVLTRIQNNEDGFRPTCDGRLKSVKPKNVNKKKV